jgi:hypothetical protein
MAERVPLFTPAHFLRRRGLYRGVLGGNRAWLTVFVIMVSGRVLRNIVARSEQVAAVERLGPGQRLLITTIDPATERRSRKRR